MTSEDFLRRTLDFVRPEKLVTKNDTNDSSFYDNLSLKIKDVEFQS